MASGQSHVVTQAGQGAYESIYILLRKIIGTISMFLAIIDSHLATKAVSTLVDLR